MVKLGGRHRTIVGGRRGIEIVSRIASYEKVKRVVPGRIEAKGDRTGHGLRFKITRVDGRGNIKIILSNGSSNQTIYVITTASNQREGEIIAEEIASLIKQVLG